MSLLLRSILVVHFCFVFSAAAHREHQHEGKSGTSPERKAEPKSPGVQKSFQEINSIYLEKVKPVFERTCFDCHSGLTRFPWYHFLPVVRGCIDRDIKEAKSHIDFSSGFPFAGHGSASEDLSAIKKVVETGSMPPLRYRVMHPSSGLTSEEKKVVLEWIVEGQRKLASEGAGDSSN